MNPTSWVSPKVKLMKSSIHGVGLFAFKKISKDEIVAYKGGHLIDTQEFINLSRACKGASLQIDDDVYLAPLNTSQIKNVLVGINHSCEPNVGISGQIGTVAMRDIDVGEELTGDYVVAYQNEAYMFDCLCGQKNCRGKISSKDWMNTKLQRRYKGYFSIYVQKLINSI